MPDVPLNLAEQAPGEHKQVDCVEVYLPKSIEFLSELYRFLRDMVTRRLGPVVLDGFSVYEVDGVFRGERLWEQRTLVIRLLLIRPSEKPAPLLSATINSLGTEIAFRVARQEEEIWICHYPQNLVVFRGLRRIMV